MKLENFFEEDVNYGLKNSAEWNTMNFIKIWMKEQGLLPRIRSRTTGHETGETNRSPRLEYARGTDHAA
jgi:hypothetical protein